MMYRTVTCYLTCMFHGNRSWFCSFGKGRRLLASDLNPNLSSLTYTVTYLFFSFFHDFLTHHFNSHLLGFFCSWGGMDFTFVFIKDLEAETIHVCIAWALLKLSGMCFLFYLFVFIYWAFLVHRFIRRGMGDTRYSLLPCHGDMWLVGFGCERNHGMRSCSLFEIDILGVFFSWNISRVNWPYALKMVFFFLFIIYYWLSFLVVSILDHVFIFFVAPDSLPLPSFMSTVLFWLIRFTWFLYTFW